MPGKCKKTFIEQLDICQRRIQGHLDNPNSNKERYYRLLTRESYLQNEVFSLQKSKSKGRSGGKPFNKKDKKDTKS